MSEPVPDLHRWKLPRGRHGLPPEVVARSQRERLLAAVVRVSAARGYRDASVADILAAAGVGRESFYRHFKDKEGCFLAANDALVEELEARVVAQYEQPGEWTERVRGTLVVALDWLAADPEVARVMMVEMGTVGPIANERFADLFRRFIVFLDDGPKGTAGGEMLPNVASIAGGAIFARIHDEVSRDNTALLPQQLPDLLFELLLPYIGEEAAGSERKSARSLVGESDG
jgi:AcrR family transcriptional regulator